MSSRDLHCTNLDKLCRICGNLLGKKALAKENYITQLHSVFFINITKDLQCIHPPKICMKCYLLTNTASKRNSTISLKTYKNWCPHDDYSWGTCARITELSKGALGKMKNTIKNDQRGRPALSKLFWSQEDLDMLSAKCPPDNLPIDIENSYFKEKWNPHLSICMCNICNNILRRPVVLKPCEHAFCFICIAKELRGQDKKSAKCFKCGSQIYEITEHGVYEKLVKVLKMDCSTCQKLFSMDEYDSFKLHTSKCVTSASTANETKLTDIFKMNKQDQLTRDMEDVALHVLENKIAHSNSPEIQFKTGGRVSHISNPNYVILHN